jgi:hypothetical protein
VYANAKMIPVETVPVMRKEGIKDSSRRSEFKYDIFDTNLCKCHNVPPPSTTKQLKK